MSKKLGIGIIGYGFIGKVHTYAYLNMPLFYDPVPADINLVGVCTAHIETVKKAVQQAGFKFATTNYKDLLERNDVDIINCCTPNYLHKEVLINAIKAGKHVYCDKPLALNLKEAEEIIQIAKKSKVKHQMAFEYRFIPAIIRAKQLISEGALGRVYSFRTVYLHSGSADPDTPKGWKMDKKMAGGGVILDLGPHIVDLIYFLLGGVKEIFATTETFIKRRPVKKGSNQKVIIDTEDIALIQMKMKDGSLGTVEVSKVATGTNDELRLEIHGSHGAIYFNLMDPNWLWFYDTRDKKEPVGGMRGFKKIETVQRYPDSIFPGPKFSIGWLRFHAASLYKFVNSIVENKTTSPNIHDGYKVQEIMDFAYLSSVRKTWIKLI